MLISRSKSSGTLPPQLFKFKIKLKSTKKFNPYHSKPVGTLSLWFFNLLPVGTLRQWFFNLLLKQALAAKLARLNLTEYFELLT